ncbi:ParB/RepB/Spo0J family partition protein [Thermosulfurimonas sp. F29]|uniref:ParB/RepB/Spo0J family partition protein n=1 Tax=Thermosulfurimonas sp. F29 TaxID=2867247 RepID=UPI001C83A9F8|nr:ParB/RepB/Spo0J family partition protein [Thermosulfurimonas sp. F29]MBX6423246.1 ParB/RepB/Spo0J family partition protein [Thermosulfurimonas sp. F29]
MKIVTLRLADVDLLSRTFVFSLPPRDTLLLESVKRRGVIEPPVVLEGEDGFVPVAGEGRLLAARALGLEEVSCRVLPGMPPVEAQWLALESNLFRGLNLAEKAEVVARLSRYLSPEEVVRRVFPLLGLRSDPEGYFFLKALSEAPESLKLQVASGRLSPRAARALLRCPRKAQPELLDLLERLRFTASERQEVVEGLLDLARREDLPLEEVLSRFRGFERREEFLRALRKALRPSLSRMEEKALRLREVLRGKGVLLEIPPALEREEWSLKIPFRSREGLLRKLDDLRNLLSGEPGLLGDIP